MHKKHHTEHKTKFYPEHKAEQQTDLRSPLKRWLTLPFVTAGLVAIGLPPQVAQAANPYQVCAESLVERGIANAEAADACAAALYPRDLSECVADISSDTEIVATEALSACRQVRRPEELANCVVDIDSDTTDAQPLNVLESCRQSLLPERYSDCVVGVTNEIEISTPVALETCASASNLPTNVLPDFIPRTENPPELDPSIPPSELPEFLPFETSPLSEPSQVPPPSEATPTPVAPSTQTAPAPMQ